MKYELIKPEKLHLIIRDTSKVSKISEEFPKSKISAFENVKELDADLIIISVKPQDFHNVAENFQFVLKENQMVLSIMAGIKSEKAQKLLRHPLIVQAMPNSPNLLGMGITDYTSA